MGLGLKGFRVRGLHASNTASFPISHRCTGWFLVLSPDLRSLCRTASSNTEPMGL